jgi:predicted transcriptional regulator
MASNSFGYTPGKVLRALAARDAPTLLDDLAGDLGRNAQQITLGLRNLMMEGHIDVTGPEGQRVAQITQKGREHLYEDDLLDRWN